MTNIEGSLPLDTLVRVRTLAGKRLGEIEKALADTTRTEVFAGLLGWSWEDKESRAAAFAAFDALSLARRREVLKALWSTVALDKGRGHFSPTSVRLVASSLAERVPGWTGEWITV